MTNAAIRKAGPVIRRLCPHSILVVSPEKYNEVHLHHNIVDMKARLHDQAWKHLVKKAGRLPEVSVVDQFVQEKSYYKYAGPDAVRPLRFETKAESRYLAVAAASVLAREAFLKYWDDMEDRWQMHFQKGAGPAVDKCGRLFLETHSREELGKVAKLHFRNTEDLPLKKTAEAVFSSVFLFSVSRRDHSGHRWWDQWNTPVNQSGIQPRRGCRLPPSRQESPHCCTYPQTSSHTDSTAPVLWT